MVDMSAGGEGVQFGVEGQGFDEVGYGTASMAGETSAVCAQYGIEGAGEGGVGYGTSAMTITESHEYDLGGQTTTTTTSITTTTTSNIEGIDGGLDAMQSDFLPSAYESTNPLEQPLSA